MQIWHMKFPAINWLTSYSLYNLGKWFNTNVDEKWMDLRARIMKMLNDEAELDEIVKLVGMDTLSAPDRLKLEAARSIREDFYIRMLFMSGYLYRLEQAITYDGIGITLL